jgi:putative MATE family efflux protein
MLIGFGGAALISLRLGQRRRADAERILGNATLLLIIGSLVLTTVGLVFFDPILTCFGASRPVLPFARAYFRVIAAGAIFQCLLFGLNAMIRSQGNPVVAMSAMLLSVLLNLALAPLLIIWAGWGVFGAALATVLSQAVSAAWMLLHILVGKSALRFHLGNFRLHAAICLDIFSVGLPSCAMMLVNCVFWCILLNRLGYYGGDLAIAVWGIIYRVLMVFFTPVIGLYQGAQPIIGYNYGAGRFDRVKRALEVAVLAATALMTCGFALSMGLPGQLIRLFLGDQQKDVAAVLALGTHAIRLATLMLPLVGFQIIAANYFQAIGKPLQAMVLALSRQVILLIPILLVLPRFFGLNGIWGSFPCADLCSSVLTAVCLFWELRRLREKHLDTAAAAWAPAPAGE